MAGASMNAIKSRIKSVESTRQITKAMELVATSKLRRAKERAEGSKPYHKLLLETTFGVMGHLRLESNPFTEVRKIRKTCYIIIAGDRGLAGGYNNNIFRLSRPLMQNDVHCVLPIGKKSYEHYLKHKEEILCTAFPVLADVNEDDCLTAATLLTEMYKNGEIDRVMLIYTRFESMLQQECICEQLLPFDTSSLDSKTTTKSGCAAPIADEDPAALIEYLIPLYLSGILSSAVSESLASECASRRNAMNSANKNADEIIGTLQLHYNRARQAAITQEITEIVSGAEAL